MTIMDILTYSRWMTLSKKAGIIKHGRILSQDPNLDSTDFTGKKQELVK
jgi:hypothetical protein